MFLEALRTLVSSPIITLNFQRGRQEDVLAALRWQPILGSKSLFRTTEKAGFAYRTPIKMEVFPSKAQTLLLSKNLGY